ncbi:MAG TPA: hypothetical protein VGO11_21620 [Chthoniobacteraceae bacterium]|jgi:hypothetical protein|nr:hypothetical protein [Chthoniobacteraceae bacterium]
MKITRLAFLLFFLAPTAWAESGLAAIKNYLVTKVTTMDRAAHDYVAHATAYDKVIQANHGDYNAAVLQSGPELLALIAKMQGDYRDIHNTGYETIEGIVAGVRPLVDFDTYLDAGVPKSEASTDSPSSPLVLKTADGKTIVDRQGNLFHYVMEPTLWGTKANFVKPLNAEAQAKVKGAKVLPRADVALAAAVECARKLDQLLAASQKWPPTLDECVGALVWMTPTLNGYFEDWKDSRYNPNAALGRYVAESRVIDMRGIMYSLRLTYKALQPEIAKKDPALAKKLESDYDGIMGFLDKVDARERKGSKLTVQEIEEMAFQAKSLTDQLVPKLKQVVALLGLKLPPKPILA